MGRTGAVVLALIVGLGVGYYLGTLSKGGGHGGGGNPGLVDYCLTPQPQHIDVGANGAVSCPTGAAISQQFDSPVYWTSQSGSTLWVNFDKPVPFTTMTSDGNVVSAHGVLRTFTPPVTAVYHTNVFLAGTPTPGPLTPTPRSMDGRIIIMK